MLVVKEKPDITEPQCEPACNFDPLWAVIGAEGWPTRFSDNGLILQGITIWLGQDWAPMEDQNSMPIHILFAARAFIMG